ncbi:MAG: FtsW/RodA/SpoVE family cell cycle protein, partial [bacterium]|nr:FtsW/RodA/SpoVE family cell cycle protein [bacterium]
QAYRAKNRNGGLLLAGIAGLWVYQIFVNVAMTLGLMPVAGIPLPFLSYGGSSMLTHCALMGFAIGASTRWRSYA